MAKIEICMLMLVAAINLSSEEVHDDFLHIYHRLKKTNCIDDTGVTQDLIENANHGEFADDRKLMCYMECHMEEMDIINDNGAIDYDRIMPHIPDNHKLKMGPILKECCEIDVFPGLDLMVILHEIVRAFLKRISDSTYERS